MVGRVIFLISDMASCPRRLSIRSDDWLIMYTNNPVKVAVVGGGIAGLSAAWYLERNASRLGRDLLIELFESQSRLGGKIWTLEQDRMKLELGAESFLSRKTAAVELCRELGVDRQLRGTRPENRKTFVWHRGKNAPTAVGFEWICAG